SRYFSRFLIEPYFFYNHFIFEGYCHFTSPNGGSCSALHNGAANVPLRLPVAAATTFKPLERRRAIVGVQHVPQSPVQRGVQHVQRRVRQRQLAARRRRPGSRGRRPTGPCTSATSSRRPLATSVQCENAAANACTHLRRVLTARVIRAKVEVAANDPRARRVCEFAELAPLDPGFRHVPTSLVFFAPAAAAAAADSALPAFRLRPPPSPLEPQTRSSTTSSTTQVIGSMPAAFSIDLPPPSSSR
ncbi:hypothetical protein DFJ73DRAFT_896261, partial [Zopfochytrium polystomum]